MPALRGPLELPAPDRYGGRSTATTPLGHFLSFGTHHGVGNTGSVPSGTSRYYSVDLGLVHFIALDLNMYAYTAEPYRLQSISLFDFPSHFAVISWITRLLRRSRYAPYPFAAKPQLDWLEADLQVGRPLIITEMDPSALIIVG